MVGTGTAGSYGAAVAFSGIRFADNRYELSILLLVLG